MLERNALNYIQTKNSDNLIIYFLSRETEGLAR